MRHTYIFWALSASWNCSHNESSFLSLPSSSTLKSAKPAGVSNKTSMVV